MFSQFPKTYTHKPRSFHLFLTGHRKLAAPKDCKTLAEEADSSHLHWAPLVPSKMEHIWLVLTDHKFNTNGTDEVTDRGARDRSCSPAQSHTKISSGQEWMWATYSLYYFAPAFFYKKETISTYLFQKNTYKLL